MCVALAVLIAACGGVATPSSIGPTAAPPSATASTSTAGPADGWAADLAQLDEAVRRSHPSPFTVNPESAWTAALAQARALPADASTIDRLGALGRLVGLLDTHSALLAMPGGWHFYGVVPYRFSDGWFLVRAVDTSLVGARLVAIDGVPIDEVERRLTPFVPHDNESGLLEGLEWVIDTVEYLHAAGVPAGGPAGFEVRLPDGSTNIVQPPVLDEQSWGADLVPIGWLQGSAPEAVARRDERVWTRLDEAGGVLLISVNDYGDMAPAIEELKAVLDAGTATRVVLDMRYLRGGSGDIALVGALADDPRTAGKGGLVVLIGRENVSAATRTAAALERETEAVFVGEPTPARADNFLCECVDITLDHSGFVIELPTYWARTGDLRPAVAPDFLMPLSSEDFFAGRDPVLEAALDGALVGAPANPAP